LISILGVSIYSGNAEGANWKSYGKKYSNTTDYLYFYDKDSVVYPNKGIVRVWVKHVTTEEGLKKMRREDEIERERWKAEGEKTKAKREREKAKLREKEDPKMQELLEVVRKVTAEIKGMVIEKEKTLLFEMNCSQRTFRILECYSYYEDGSHSPRGWIDVSPTVTLSEFPTGWYNVYVDTPIEALYKVVCRRSIFSW
jgi:hypothetical protein